MSIPPDKAGLFAALRTHLMEQLQDLTRGQTHLSDGLRVDGSHRPANRGERGAVTSAGYLAAGLQARQAELTETLKLLDRTPPSPRTKAVTGALVTIEHDEGETTWLIFPGAAGVVVDGVAVVSPSSPVGTALWGLEEGDVATLPKQGAVEVVQVQ